MGAVCLNPRNLKGLVQVAFGSLCCFVVPVLEQLLSFLLMKIEKSSAAQGNPRDCESVLLVHLVQNPKITSVALCCPASAFTLPSALLIYIVLRTDNFHLRLGLHFGNTAHVQGGWNVNALRWSATSPLSFPNIACTVSEVWKMSLAFLYGRAAADLRVSCLISITHCK